MNSFFGRSEPSDPKIRAANWGFSQYKQFMRTGSVPEPAMTWVTLDEHPDTINDAFFINNPSLNYWQDIPASYHNGACGFSFADGHAEIKKWTSVTSKFPVKTTGAPPPKNFDAAGRQDFRWYNDRVQLIPVNSR